VGLPELLLLLLVIGVIWFAWSRWHGSRQAAGNTVDLKGRTANLPNLLEIISVTEFKSKQYHSHTVQGTSQASSYYVPAIRVRIANKDDQAHSIRVVLHKKDDDVITDTSAVYFPDVPPKSKMDGETIFHGEGSNKTKPGAWYITACELDRTSYSIDPIRLNTKEGFSPCFVTTTAYSDPHHPIVGTFRSLRDEVLVNYKAGRAFIDWYNHNGPRMAATIENRPLLRAAVRVILTPLAATIKEMRAVTRQLRL
jgi:hypothetical protein